VDFLREIGSLFSVNRMLTAECYKSRMEKGLTFLEFNYMLMQAYDFLELNRRYGCILQMGGDDQWSNILAGADLIRRKEKKVAFGLTCKLLLKSDGKKMGKTEGGAVWLDAEKTSPYDFYQYWRNVEDDDVENCLKLLTFLPLEEIAELTRYKDERINTAKKRLAFEVTKLVHGEEEAEKAQSSAEALFGAGGAGDSVPATEFTKEEIDGMLVSDAMIKCGITKSRGEGRRLIKQGAVSIDGDTVTDEFMAIDLSKVKDGSLMLRKGKKVYHKLVVV
jgi:tyrosyl-tRNA synthetase